MNVHSHGVSVYYLIDPRTQQVRYVGYTHRPYRRYVDHTTSKEITHKGNWILGLQKIGLQPIFSVRCVVQTEDEAKRIEIALIARLPNLTNMTAGGDGGAISEEAKLKISQKLQGHRHLTESGREKIRLANRRPMPEAQKEKIRQANKKAWLAKSPEEQIQTYPGRSHTLETIQKLRNIFANFTQEQKDRRSRKGIKRT